MLKFISNSLCRNKKRFILLLIGITIFSGVLIYLFGIKQGNTDVTGDLLPQKEQSSTIIEELTEEIIPLDEKNSASGISPGASAVYNIDLALDEQDVFQISAEIDVTNESQDSWTDIGFYFIPNALTDANKPDFMEDGAETAISGITSDGEEIPFELVDNRLLLKLDAELKPDEMKTVKIDYTLKLPESGNRLSQMDDNYYLAQWYPMLGHYSDGWNIENYDSKGESYHTSYGSYEIDYQLPTEYLVASSAEDREFLPTASGTVAGDNIKDFYLALMDPDDWHTAASSVNNTALRVYIPSAGLDFTADMMAVAEDTFAFFEEKIADHPAEELDVIANDGGMEYPNIIEVTSNPSDYEHTLIHEIAHQWFYYLVANDPYTDSWLDESITEWVASMYMVEEGYQDPFAFAARIAQTRPTAHLINLPLNEFEKGDYYSTIYGKTPLLLQEYFEANGGSDAAFDFLSAYVEQFRFDYVDTEKFAEFFVEQHGEDSREFLNSWLDLEKE